MFATDHFRAYLLGRKFTAVTDHHALRWLHSVSSKGRLGRWVMDLQEYSFDVRHRPGNDNGNADALSCLPLSLAVQLLSILVTIVCKLSRMIWIYRQFYK